MAHARELVVQLGQSLGAWHKRIDNLCVEFDTRQDKGCLSKMLSQAPRIGSSVRGSKEHDSDGCLEDFVEMSAGICSVPRPSQCFLDDDSAQAVSNEENRPVDLVWLPPQGRKADQKAPSKLVDPDLAYWFLE